MGLTKTSFEISDSQVTQYDWNWATVNKAGSWVEMTSVYYNTGTTGDYRYYNSCVQITTDSAGASSLTFRMAGRGRGPTFGVQGQVRFAVKATKTPPAKQSTSEGAVATRSDSSPYCYGTLTGLKLMPNTTYYLFFWATGEMWGYNGTLTLIATGTYGAPGTLTANNANFDGNVNISYASATSGATYTVTAKVGTSTAETLQTNSSTSSRTWVPSLATYASQYPNQSTVSAVITVQTYFGGTLSGTTTKTITLSFTAAQVGPSTSSAFTIAPYNTGVISGMSGYIQNYSRIRASFSSGNVTLKSGATVSKWTVKFGSATAVDVAAGTGTKDSEIISQTTEVTCTVTDSRGFTASETYTATITPYQNPALQASVFRCDAQGNEADDGTYMAVSLIGLYASIAGQNSLTAQVFSKLASASSYGTGVTVTGGSTTVSGTNKSYEVADFLIAGYADAVYDIMIVITDGLGNTNTVYVTVESQAWALHIRNGGRGAAFGKAAERDNELDIGDWLLTCGGISSIIDVEFASFSSLPKTVTDPKITEDHKVFRHELGTPASQTADWTVTTADGSLTVSGSISGSTTLRLVLGIPGTVISA